LALVNEFSPEPLTEYQLYKYPKHGGGMLVLEGVTDFVGETLGVCVGDTDIVGVTPVV
jgi:hypothetical protein